MIRTRWTLTFLLSALAVMLAAVGAPGIRYSGAATAGTTGRFMRTVAHIRIVPFDRPADQHLADTVNDTVNVGSLVSLVNDARHSTGLAMVEELNARQGALHSRGLDRVSVGCCASLVLDERHSTGHEFACMINRQYCGLPQVIDVAPWSSNASKTDQSQQSTPPQPAADLCAPPVLGGAPVCPALSTVSPPSACDLNSPYDPYQCDFGCGYACDYRRYTHPQPGCDDFEQHVDAAADSYLALQARRLASAAAQWLTKAQQDLAGLIAETTTEMAALIGEQFAESEPIMATPIPSEDWSPASTQAGPYLGL